jgi:hypothetical protein
MRRVQRGVRFTGTQTAHRPRVPPGRRTSRCHRRPGRRAAKRTLAARQQFLGDLIAHLEARERVQLGVLVEHLLKALTESRSEARKMCRLCDHDMCERKWPCPVDGAAAALGE